MSAMYHKLEILCFIVQICIVLSAGNISLPQIPKDFLGPCIVSLLSSKSQFGSDLAVINNDVVTDGLVREIHASNNVRLYVKDHNVSVSISPSIFIIHVQDLLNFKILIDSLNRDWHRKPDALYIIIARGVCEDDFTKIFGILWEYHIIRTLVIVGEMLDNASVYSYFPYAEGRCGQDYNNTMEICECKNVTDVDIMELLSEYDKPNLKNCTLKIVTHNFPPLVISEPDPINELAIGIEKFVLEMLLLSENISWNYTYLPETQDFGSISDNFTVSGKLQKLYQNEVDLVFGGYNLNYRRVIFFDFICTHLSFEDRYVVITSRVGFVQRWKIVYQMFELNVWLLLLFIMVFCAVMLSNVGKLLTKPKKNFFTTEFFRLFGSATLNIALFPRKNIFQTVLIVHWLWFTFLVVSFYQTRLTSYSTYRAYKPQLNSFESLHSHNLTPCLSRSISSFLKDSQYSIINEEYLEHDNCETNDKALDKIAETSTKYTATLYLQYLWWINKHMKEKDTVHVMEQSIFNTLYAFFFKRGFPLLRKFNHKMLRLVENGFLQGIKGFHQIPQHSKASEVKGSFEISLLKLEDLTVPFCLLISGSGFALFVFIIETLHRGNDHILIT